MLRLFKLLPHIQGYFFNYVSQCWTEISAPREGLLLMGFFFFPFLFPVPLYFCGEEGKGELGAEAETRRNVEEREGKDKGGERMALCN